MKTFKIQSQVWLAVALETLYPFFADAKNLEVLTPPWLRFQVLTSTPIDMHTGTLIDYRLRVRGLPLRWQSEITVWEPPYRFIDEQRRGPYRLWNHVHTFQPKDGGTLAEDNVEYSVWGGSIVNRLFVSPDLDRIFSYRRSKLLEIFGDDPARPAREISVAK